MGDIAIAQFAGEDLGDPHQLMLSRPLYGGRHHLKAVLGNPHTTASHLDQLADLVAQSLRNKQP